MSAAPPLSTITLRDTQVRQAVAGQGEPLLLLHGWGANSALVWDLAEQLIPQGYRAFAPDLPGFGQTPAPDQPWTVYDYADWVMAYMDFHQLERVYLFGHSFGGRLGIALGALHPQRIIKMALANSAGVRPKTSKLAQWRLGAYKGLRDQLTRLGARRLAEELRRRYNARYASSDFQATEGIFRQTFINVVREDMLPLAAQVVPSTLLFWGDRDEDTPLWQGQLLEKTIPDAGLIVYEGAGHYSYLERLAETAHTMHYFFHQAPQA
ncbi:MAG: alpha/beta hydrolase [Anaerolineae bacterium]|nr:alpha/beta hydrolase [Anaerolineae bacterium]MDW8173031.1 alpha/beta hydrolase [Anaerolineae bacterium]